MIKHHIVDVKYSKNVLEENKELINSLGNKCLIVTGKTSAKLSGALEDFLNIYKGEYIIFDQIKENPKVETILKVNELLEGIDFVVGIGGGSVQDASKAIANMVTNKTNSEEELYKQTWPNKKVPLILIGTSAGTGSEVTRVAVLSKANKRKSSLNPECFYATYALCNPVYTYSMNDEIRLTTGIDAFAHLVESYFSNKATDVSRGYSIEGLKLVIPALDKLRNKELNDSVKDDLYLGSLYGGLAIDVTGTTFAHNVGYYLSEEHNIHHGFACGEFMEDLFAFQSLNNKEYLNKFLNELNMDKDYIVKLIKDLMPAANVKLTEEEIDNLLPRWDNNKSVLNSYGKMSLEDIRNILIKHFN
ncbi:MAG: iron-containing alcohol dehydrogenase [Erysipelotrichaceae bacterium]|nr:iron-containing alcohol dehydrogenase [Erysipelotrichaceae bacterium]